MYAILTKSGLSFMYKLVREIIVMPSVDSGYPHYFGVNSWVFKDDMAKTEAKTKNLNTEWFVWRDIFTALFLLLRLSCPMVILFERVPSCLQFSSRNFGKTNVAYWEMFCKPDPLQSMIINSAC